MKQFKIYILVCLLVVGAINSIAQPTNKHDKIKALRVTFINQKVNFTPQESQAFWPIYDEYNEKLGSVKRTFREQYIKNVDFTTLTDKEAEAYINAELSVKQKEYELHKEYFEKFRKILPIKKVALLRRAEEEFRRELIKNIKGGHSSE